jgi:hypothetical protein
MRPYLKNNQSKKGWRRGSSSRERLLSKYETLSSNPVSQKKKNPGGRAQGSVFNPSTKKNKQKTMINLIIIRKINSLI